MTMVGGIPSRLLLQPSRLGTAAAQTQLSKAQAESATGRHSDVGLALGNRTGADIALRAHLSNVEAAATGTNLAALRAETVQSALSSLGDLAGRFRSTLSGTRDSTDGRALSRSFAAGALDSLHDALSVTQDGQYLFSGLASDLPPLSSYGSGPRQAIVDAFQSTFGFPPDDPAAADLTEADVSGFLDGSFATLFSGSGWSSTWSSATDETPGFRLPSGAAVNVSASANGPFAQKLAQALGMVDVLGSSKINGKAFTAVVDKSLSLAFEAQSAVTSEQARIGIGQERLKNAQSLLDERKSHLTAAISALESVDPYDAATRVNLLMTQLESSYALTGRISKMSLLSYI